MWMMTVELKQKIVDLVDYCIVRGYDMQAKEMRHEINQEIEALTAEVALLKAEREWIVFGDRFPDENRVLVVQDGVVTTATYYERIGCWFRNGQQVVGITHWMHMPQPPAQAGGEG
jgi:hypothetical protein